MVLKKLLESIFQFFHYKSTKNHFMFAFYFYGYIFLYIFADVIDNKRINQAWKQIQ